MKSQLFAAEMWLMQKLARGEGMNITCKHDMAERDTAIADGMCPLCLEAYYRAACEQSLKLAREVSKREAETKRLRDALIPVPDKLSLEQLRKWLDMYETKREAALNTTEVNDET